MKLIDTISSIFLLVVKPNDINIVSTVVLIESNNITERFPSDNFVSQVLKRLEQFSISQIKPLLFYCLQTLYKWFFKHSQKIQYYR